MARDLLGALFVLAFAFLIGVLVSLLNGCASFSQVCRYDELGRLVEQRTESGVVGTGETELATSACAALSYSTRDTGVSDNATALGGAIAEGAARGAVGAVVP